MFKKIYHISDQGIILDFGKEINKEINGKVISVFNYLNFNSDKKKEFGIINCIPSYNKILIQYDLSQVTSDTVLKYISSIREKQLSYYPIKKTAELPICYDEEYGIDLKSISYQNNISIKEIIHLHSKTNFYVYMLGFMPGLPFMGDLNIKLFTSRLTSPRLRVPALSVGIVEKYCVIYPFESPGGWNIIGRTTSKMFFKDKKQSTLLYPGMNVKFITITKSKFIKLESNNNE